MNHLNDVFERFKQISIAVIGDLCLDFYYTISPEKSEISIETGLSTRAVSSMRHGPGGAGNVAVNCKTLGAACVDLYGVIGPDLFGDALQGSLSDAGVSCDYIRTQPDGWDTHVYHKVYSEGNEEPRFDIGNFNQAGPETVAALLSTIESNLERYDAVIINEQVLHGYHTVEFQRGLTDLIKRNRMKLVWISDCRHLNSIYSGSIRKLNIHEARDLFRQLRPASEVPGQTDELLRALRDIWGSEVVITRGEDGAIAISESGEICEVQGVNLLGPQDSVGAGDAFLAGFALCSAAGVELNESLKVGNLAAAVSVTKLQQTGHPTVDEILSLGESPDYRYNPVLAKDDRRAEYIAETPVELAGALPLPFPRIAIFDHDGTLSTLRQGWEVVMERTSMAAILGENAESVPSEIIGTIHARVAEMIEKTTGVQTIIQMHFLRDLVRSCGFVPEDEILTPAEYKALYNRELIGMVSSRIGLFQKGQLELSDLTIKGAIPFLGWLRESGVRLYLASGTDQDDVRHEAAVLGYDHLFDGGIFGSVGDVANDPKRMVIGKIVESLPPGLSPSECYMFGDGPVEMREAAKRDFTRIGLMSDEKVRFGPNPDKRSRLILGGAQLLLPDFSWMDVIRSSLGWKVD